MSNARPGPTRRRALAGLGAAAFVTGCASPPPAGFIPPDDWAADDHAAALSAFRKTAATLAKNGGDWAAVAQRALATPPGGARDFFETAFALAEPIRDARFTAYYEPVLEAARRPGGQYIHPVYAPPPELTDTPYHTRAEIEAGALSGRGLELFWLADPAEMFFLHVQGSGRLSLPGGETVRIGYAGRNNHPYRAIGADLLATGEITADAMSADAIKDWIRARPEAGAALMRRNPSFIFFLEISGLGYRDGPVGAMGAPVTAHRSIAVDPAAHVLGAPVWVRLDMDGYRGRLMVAQDVGAAIVGARRADLFFGSGPEAGAAAGNVNMPGQMTALRPAAMAGV